MKNLNDRSIVYLAIFTAVIVGGAAPVFAKIALKETSPALFTFLRACLSTLVVLPFLIKYRIKLDKNLIKAILVTLFLTANFLIFAYGVRLTTASISQIIYVISPVVIAVLSYLILNERINSKKVLGIILGFIGAGVIVILPVLDSNPFSGNLIGNLLIMLAVLTFSLYSVLSKKLHINFSPIQIVIVLSFTTLFAMAPLTLYEVLTSGTKIFNISRLALFSIFYVGAIMTVAYYTLHQYAIKHGSPLAASTIVYLQPVATFVWAAVLLGEGLTPGVIVGGTIAFLGTYFIINASSKKEIIDIEQKL